MQREFLSILRVYLSDFSDSAESPPNEVMITWIYVKNKSIVYLMYQIDGSNTGSNGV